MSAEPKMEDLVATQIEENLVTDLAT